MRYSVLLLLFVLCFNASAQDYVEQSLKLSKRAGKLFDKGKFEKSIWYYSDAIKIYKGHPFNYYYRGLAYSFTENYSAALKDFNQCLSLDPKNKNAYLARARANKALNKFGDALDDYTTYIDLNETDITAKFEKGNLLVQLEKYKSAIPLFDQILKRSPSNIDALLSRTRCLIEIEAFQKAKQDLTKINELDEANNELTALIGFFDLQTDRPAIAVDKLEQATSNDLSNPVYFYWLSKGYYQSGNIDDAINTLGKVIALDSAAKYYNERGSLKVEKEDIEGALTDFTKAIEIDPNDKSALSNRTFFVWFAQDKYQNAVEDLTRVIELDSSNAYAYSNRSYAHLKLGNIEHGFIDAFHSIELERRNPYVYKNLALLYDAIGEPHEAVESAKGAISWGYPVDTDEEFKSLLKKLEKEHPEH